MLFVPETCRNLQPYHVWCSVEQRPIYVISALDLIEKVRKDLLNDGCGHFSYQRNPSVTTSAMDYPN